MAQIPAKKRKLSSVSTSSAKSTNEALSGGSVTASGDHLSNNQAVIEPSVDHSSAPEAVLNGTEVQSNNGHAVLEDGISNSEVYQIYCRNKDPKEAMKEIIQLKSLYHVWKPAKPFPDGTDFKNACETVLDRLWKLEPHLNDSKFDKIRKYINGNITESQLTNSNDKIKLLTSFQVYFTRIRILLPMGYEFCYISNFDMGPRVSKWYRGQSSRLSQDCKLAKLHVLGIDNATIAKLHYDQ